MKFSNGVYAKVEFKTQSKGYKSTHFSGCSEDLYDEIEYYFGHETAAEASSWAELASTGEKYEHEEFVIEMVEV